MTIQRVIEWHEGAPEKLEAGMFVQWSDGFDLIGSVEDGVIPDVDSGIIRWATLIKPHELTWAASMAKRHLAK